MTDVCNTLTPSQETTPTPSSHQVPVVRLNIKSLEGTKNLGLVLVNGMSQVVVNTNDWKTGDLAAYVQPDSLVDVTRPEFSFLGRHNRIKTRKFQGTWSQGLLVPAPPDAQEGDDVAELLGVKHYNPEDNISQGCYGSSLGSHRRQSEPVPHPLSCLSKYDVESLRKYHDQFTEGEEIILTEKIHGASSRYVWMNDFSDLDDGVVEGRFYCGTRTRWCFPDGDDPWWKALHETPLLQEWLKNHPGMIVYAELYGNVQSLKYGFTKDERKLAVFDIFDTTTMEFMSHDAARLAAPDLPWVPVIYRGPYTFATCDYHSSGVTVIGGGVHLREGIVAKPIIERKTYRHQRVCYKLVSNEYLAL